MVLHLGCTSVFLQDDGFRSKLAHGCANATDCEALRHQAQARVDGCKANTVGYVRCDEASADLRQASSLVATARDKEATQSPRTEIDDKAPASEAAPDSSDAESASVASTAVPNDDLKADQQAVQRAVVEGTETELRTGRCTPTNAATLQRALGFAKQSASTNFIFTDHRLIVATNTETSIELTAGLPGEYHVFAVLPGIHRKFQLKVFDADGYEVSEQSHYTGFFSMYGMTSSGGSTVQWPSTVDPIKISARGEGCAMLVVAYRIGS